MKNENTDTKLQTNEVIGLWAAIQHHDFGLVDVGWDHQRLRDEFAKLISRPDIGDGDRLWLRWLAENDSEWIVATSDAAPAYHSMHVLEN